MIKSVSLDYKANHMMSNEKSPAHKRNNSSRNTPNMFDRAQMSSVRQSLAKDLDLNEEEVAAYLQKQRVNMASRTSKNSNR